jgi:ribosomal-protein-alanine N-acetyltransferase
VTSRVSIRLLREDDADALYALRLRNRDYLEPWGALPENGLVTAELERQAVVEWIARAETDQGFAFVVEHEGMMVGRVTLSDVRRGRAQSAVLGYWIAEEWRGRGFAAAAARLAVEFAFFEAGLHRVEAGVMPRNAASIRVLEKAGFREEGLNVRLLRINGVWEDHKLFAITAEEV